MAEQLPDWLPRKEWAEYLKMRKAIRKPMTDHAMNLAIGKLEQLRAAGHAPADVLNQSTFNSYQGLYPVKKIEGLEQEKPQPQGVRCTHCGGATREHVDGRQCKACGRVMEER